MDFEVAAEAYDGFMGRYSRLLSGQLADFASVRREQRSGVVAACVWDHGGRQGPLRHFWDAARSMDPAVDDESDLPGTLEGHLAGLFEAAGLRQIEATALTVRLEPATFDAWWEPFTHGVGPAGIYLASLDPDRRAELRDACRREVHAEPFAVTGVAWAARGLA